MTSDPFKSSDDIFGLACSMVVELCTFAKAACIAADGMRLKSSKICSISNASLALVSKDCSFLTQEDFCPLLKKQADLHADLCFVAKGRYYEYAAKCETHMRYCEDMLELCLSQGHDPYANKTGVIGEENSQNSK